MSNPSLKRWYIPLLYTYVIVSILTGFLAFERKVSTFKPLGFYFRGTPPIVRQVEAGSNAELSGLIPGDVIESVNNQPATEDNFRTLLLEQRDGASLTLTRNGTKKNLFLQLPEGNIDLPYLFYTFTGFVFLIIGTFCYLRKKSRSSIIFFWATIFTFQILVCQPAGKLNDLWRTILGFQMLAKMLLPASMFHFTLTFPRMLSRKLVKLIPILYIVPLGIFIILLDTLFDQSIFKLSEEAIYSLNHIRTTWIAVSFLAVIVAFILQWLTVRTPAHKRQLQWILLGIAVGLLPYLLFHVIPAEAGSSVGISSLIFIPLLAFIPLTTMYSIWAYRIWEVSALIREVLSYTITLGIGFIFYLSLNNLVSMLPETLAKSRSFLLFASGIAIATLFIPIHRSIEELFIRIQYGSQFQKRQEFLNFSQKISYFSSLSTLLDSFLSQITSTLGIASANLYIHRHNHFQILYEDPQIPPVLAEEEAPSWTPVSPYSSVFQIQFQSDLLGLLILGNKSQDIPLSMEERSSITNLCSQLGLMINNLLLLESLESKVEELSYYHRFHQTVLDKSPVGIVILDPDRNILSINQAAKTLTGLSSDSERFELPGIPDTGSQELTEFGGKTVLTQSARISLGSEEHMILLISDISENISLKKELAHREHLAALGEVSASIAHEINTPLTGISSYAQLLSERFNPEDSGFRLASYITRETFRLSNMVNTLLRFVRHQYQEEMMVNLDHMIQEALHTLSPLLHSHHFKIEQIKDDHKTCVRCNDILFTQAITNILLNACQAVKWKGMVRISSGVDNDRVFLQIEDNGPGIPDAVIDTLGKSFVSIGKKDSGTGLGLALSHAIIQKCQGQIKITSSAGKGSTVRIELPYVK